METNNEELISLISKLMSTTNDSGNKIFKVNGLKVADDIVLISNINVLEPVYLKMKKSNCRTYKHENGYTNINICNCRYPKR